MLGLASQGALRGSCPKLLMLQDPSLLLAADSVVASFQQHRKIAGHFVSQTRCEGRSLRIAGVKTKKGAFFVTRATAVLTLLLLASSALADAGDGELLGYKLGSRLNISDPPIVRIGCKYG